MSPQFIEVTILLDSADELAAPRKALLRFDRITSVVDISSAPLVATPGQTRITLDEENDWVNDDPETGGGVVRAHRNVVVAESYAAVRVMMDAAGIAAGE